MTLDIKKIVKTKLEKHAKPFLSDLYQNQFTEHSDVQLDCHFVTSDNRSIPVLKNHRYAIHNSWKMFGPLSALSELKDKGLLTTKDQKQLAEAKGQRTIQIPIKEIRNILEPYLHQHADIFLNTQIPDLGHRVLKPTKQEVELQIGKKISENKKTLSKVEKITQKKLPLSSRILEVGYTSGGESILAFERLGYDSYGIDYNYDNTFETNKRHETVASLANSRANYLIGDITKKTELNEESLDLIHTLSVLEHIQNLPAAFKEMHRILKPGGIMYHRYDPYFYIGGGHLPCTLDSPWAHMRLNDCDIERYIQEMMPLEAEATLKWIRSALNRKHTQAYMQKCLVDSGFDILWWQCLELPREKKILLSPEIIKDCLQINPLVSLSDLLCYSIAFVAVKPES